MAVIVDISKITGINQVGNSYQRKSAVPLDYYSIFNSKADAQEYARTNPVAYVGQVVSVVNVDGNVASVDVYKIVQKISGESIVADLELVGDAEAITAVNAAIAELSGKITTAQNGVDALTEEVNGKGEGEAHVKGLKEKLADAETLLGTLSTNVGTNTSNITSIQDLLNGKAAQGDDPEAEGYVPAVQGLVDKINNHSTKIAQLESAGYATTGEVATAKQEAINAAVTRVLGEGVDEDFDTLKEVAEWILSDTSGAANIITRLSEIEKDYLVAADKEELQGKINTVDGKFTGVNQSITDINNLIGSLPEGTVSTTVVAYIQEAIDALKIGDYAKVSALNELAGTVSTLSGTVNNLSTNVNNNASAITVVQNKLAGIGEDQTIVGLLEGKVDKVEGSRLINATEIAILSKLSLNNGQVEIGGTVAAGSVTGLPQRLADIFDSSAEDEGKLLEGKVTERHLNSELVETIVGAVQASDLNTSEFEKDGKTVYIKNVNVSKLTQTEGDWLILNGGDSTNSWN